MKYIRTKDGVFDYEKRIKGIKFYRKDTSWARKSVYYWIKKDIEELDKSILKQADTIEELCDEFVYFINGMPFVTHKGDKHYVQGGIPVEIYGAIWTDKGLIYVAKMNEKGELKLL